MNSEQQRAVDLYLQVKREFDQLYYHKLGQRNAVSWPEWQELSKRIEECSPEICVLELRTQLYWYAKMAYFLSGRRPEESYWATIHEPRSRISLLSELFDTVVPEELRHAVGSKEMRVR